MKSYRLTHSARYQIAYAIASDLNKVRSDEVASLFRAFIQRVHESLYPQPLTSGIGVSGYYIRVDMTMGSRTVWVPFNGTIFISHVDTPQIADPEICALYEAYDSKSAESRNAHHEYYTNIRGLLDSCNTTKQLLEVWPDGFEYVQRRFNSSESSSSAASQELKRKRKAAAVAKMFIDAGVDVVTPTEVPEDEDQAA